MTEPHLITDAIPRTLRWYKGLFSLLILSFVLAISVTLFEGRRPIEKPFSADTKTLMRGIVGGRISLEMSSFLKIDIAEEWQKEGLLFNFNLQPKWIGQIFIVIQADGGTAETFIITPDVDRKPFSSNFLNLVIDEKNISLGFPGQSPLRSVPRPSGLIRSVRFDSQESIFSLDDFTICNAAWNKTYFRTDFGPSLVQLKSLALRWVFILLFLLLFRFLESRFISLIALADSGMAQTTFTAAYFPAAAALLVTDMPTRTMSMILIFIGTILWRVFILTRGEKIGNANLGWVLAALPSALPLAALMSSSVFSPALGSRSVQWILLTAALVLSFIILESLWWKYSGSLSWPEAIRASGLPFLFLAVLGIVSIGSSDTRDLSSLGAQLFIATMTAKFFYLRVFGKPLRSSQWLMAAWFCSIFGAAELSVRQSVFGLSWQRVGQTEQFRPDDHLFFVPKNLFLYTSDNEMHGDFMVDRINYRSGNTTLEKPPDTFRIVLMGGSNTWGDRLKNVEDTWAYKLEKLLNENKSGRHFEVVNAGVRGYNLFQLMVLHSLYMKNLKYDLLVLYLNFNDICSLKDYAPFTFRELFEAKTSGRWDQVDSYMKDKGLNEESSPLFKVQKQLNRSALYAGLTRAIITLRNFYTPPEIRKFGMKQVNPPEDFRKNLEQMIELARDRQAKTVLASEFVWLDPKDFKVVEQKDTDFYREMMRDTAKTHDAVFCDTHKWLMDENMKGESLVFDWDTVHLNPNGTTLLSRYMLRCLEDNHLIP